MSPEARHWKTDPSTTKNKTKQKNPNNNNKKKVELIL
jgi:hypothetical protein